jgi:hypothetical protein
MGLPIPLTTKPIPLAITIATPPSQLSANILKAPTNQHKPRISLLYARREVALTLPQRPHRLPRLLQRLDPRFRKRQTTHTPQGCRFQIRPHQPNIRARNCTHAHTRSLTTNLYLLPSTTYEAGRPDRLISLHPAGTHTRNASAVTVDAPRISYTPEERPISFTFTNTSNFDTHSRTSRSTNLNANLLDEIDDAIDQVFLYSVTSNASSDSNKTADTDILLPSTTYELPATTYEAPAKTYELPTTTYELPAPTSKLASAAYELPATAYELPATTYSPIKKKSSNNAFVLPATSYTPTPTPAPATLQPKAYDSSKTFSYDVAKKYENDIAKKYENDIAKKYENDIAKTYESDWAKQPVGRGLKAKAVAAQTVHKRKDSVVPWTDKELPPVPVDG